MCSCYLQCNTLNTFQHVSTLNSLNAPYINTLFTSWEAFFGSAMDAGDDVSDSASMYSVDRSVMSMSMSVRQRAGTGASAAASKAPAESVKNAKNGADADADDDDDHIHRPVSSLKPKVSKQAKVLSPVRGLVHSLVTAVVKLALPFDPLFYLTTLLDIDCLHVSAVHHAINIIPRSDTPIYCCMYVN